MNTDQIVDIVALIFCGGLVSFIVGGILYTILKEKREWNKGICRKCGNAWIYHTSEEDYDLTEKRIYLCKEGHMCEMTYNFDKRQGV